MSERTWCALLAVIFVGMSLAEDAREIVAEAQKRGNSESQHYEGVLQVLDSKGKISDKQWVYDRIGSHGNSKAVIRFTAPAEVKGVALLVVNHPDKASDQWMWTPAINRERRIAMQDRRTRFFGTDFSFEDLEERDVDQYEYSLKGEEPVDGESCWKIASKPRKASQYTQSLLWIQKRTYSFARIENYSDSKLIRRLSYKDITNIQGIWTARRLEMEDFTRNSKTVLKLESLKYNVPVQSDQFTIQALRRS